MIRLIYVLFVISGFLGLIYESLWARYLKLFLGHSSYGQVLTIFIYMGGLSIGSFLGGRLIKRKWNPFYIYAISELGIGLLGLIYHPLFKLSTSWIYRIIETNSFPTVVLNTLKMVGATTITLPAAILLGITFPALSAGLMRYTKDSGKVSLPILYFTNSLGAALGIIIASFFLIPYLGTSGALLFAGIGNLMIALIFGVVGKRLSKECKDLLVSKTDDAFLKDELNTVSISNTVWMWLAIAFFTGFSSFLYEIGWIRLLSLLFGSSTHSFDIMVSAFIMGMAFGGFTVKRFLKSSKNIAGKLAFIQIAMGVCAIISIYLYKPFFALMNNWHLVVKKTEASYLYWQQFKYALSILLMCPASFFAGMTLPLIICVLINKTGNEKFTGYSYGINTLGAIGGAVIGSFIILPTLQLKYTIALGGLIDIVIGLLLIFNYIKNRKVFVSILIGLMIFLLPVIPTTFNYGILTSGPYRRNVNFKNSYVTLVRDGRTATVSIHKNEEGKIALKTNGKPDASASFYPEKTGILVDEKTQLALAIYPMLSQRDSYSAAVIGMGSGLTVHHLLADDRVTSVDVIEIEKEVYRCAKEFMPLNKRAFEDKRAKLHVEDAKTFFHSSGKKYDVIISEPSNPWVSGISSLFSKEFYLQADKFLKEDGILVQWMHLYEFEDKLLLTILKALSENFTNVKIYRVPGAPDIIIMASNSKFGLKYGAILNQMPYVRGTMDRFKCHINLFGEQNLLVTQKHYRQLIKNLESNSDFFPYVDNGAEKAFYLSDKVRMFDLYSHAMMPKIFKTVEPSQKGGMIAEMINSFQGMSNLKGNDSIVLAKLSSLPDDNISKSEDLFMQLKPLYLSDSLWNSSLSINFYKEKLLSNGRDTKSFLRFKLFDLWYKNSLSDISNIESIIENIEPLDLNADLATLLGLLVLRDGNSKLYQKYYEKFIASNKMYTEYQRGIIKNWEIMAKENF